MMDLRALTVQQPWASLILSGRKPWENRPRDPGVKQTRWVAIHAGLTVHSEAGLAAELAPDLDFSDAPRGAILGLVLMAPGIPVDQVTTGKEYASGPVCLPCSDPIIFPEPIPCRGQLGLWRVPEDIVARIVGLVGLVGELE